MSVTRFTQAVQTKLWQFTHSFAADYSKPEHKFIHQSLFGLLKGGQVQINTIGRSLQEKISNKKVTKRLGYHLGKEALSFRINQSTIKVQKSRLACCKYLILDLSDIVKDYAQTMEGLARVHDGSKDELSEGYWLCNASAVSKDASTVIPLYSELYSHKAETTSQNGKIVSAINQVMHYAKADSIWVMDRGMDRNVLYDELNSADYRYIIRQNGNRNLIHNGKEQALKKISHKVKLKWEYQSFRIYKNKKRALYFSGGAVKVFLPRRKKELWLVVLKQQGHGYSWYLMNNPACLTEQDAVETVLEGYKLRWKIEEIHRQIKADYNLEAIRLQRYEALKTLNALLWMAVSFLYTRLEPMVVDIVLEPELGLVNRKKISDLLRFVYYKLSLAVKRILSLARVYYPPRGSTPKIGQLALPFAECP